MARIFTIAVILSSLAAQHSALILPEDYDSARRPNLGGVADVVNVDVDLLAIRGVDERNSEMIIDASVQTSWNDARLVNLVRRDTYFVNKAPRIWFPNVQIANAVNGLVFNPDSGGNFVLQLNKDGLVKLSQRVTSRITCAISLAKYPFDKQICRLHINSYGYSSVHLVLFWHGTISNNIPTFHPEFSFSFAEQTSENIKTPNGAEYSNLYLDIAVSRCPFRVIFRAMLPSMLLLVFSYFISFCHCSLIKPKATIAANGNGGSHVEAAQTTVMAHQNHVHDSVTTSGATTPAGIFNLLLIAINGMAFILSVFIAQINFLESPKSSSVSGLDVWLNFVTAVIFVILWHRVQLYFEEFFKSNHTGKHEQPTCYANRTTNILKLGIPPVVAVFLVIYFGIYLS